MRHNPDLDIFLGDNSELAIQEETGCFSAVKQPSESEIFTQKVFKLLETMHLKITHLESMVEKISRNADVENNLRIMKEYKVWFVYRANKQYGPFTLEQIQEGIKNEQVLTTDKVWCMQLGNPQFVSDCEHLVIK